MCIEDIKIGKATVSRTSGRLLMPGQSMVVPANGRRIALGLSLDTPLRVYVLDGLGTSTDADTWVTRFLFVLDQFNMHRLLRIEHYGVIVQSALTILASSEAGGRFVTYTEFVLAEDI